MPGRVIFHVHIPGAIWLPMPFTAAAQRDKEEQEEGKEEQEQECLVCGWLLQQRHFPMQRGSTHRKRTCFGCCHIHRVLRGYIKEGRSSQQCTHSTS